MEEDEALRMKEYEEYEAWHLLSQIISNYPLMDRVKTKRKKNQS